MAPFTAAGAPASNPAGCEFAARMASSPPGRMCRRKAIRLHIEPLGRNRPASWPRSSATRSCSSIVVGSSFFCSSPTSAVAMASRMPGLGRVWVSLRRLTPSATAREASRRGIAFGTS